ncbi:MAG: restriction endonuclease subunit R, partial [Opitutaceae bacterium]
LGLLELIVKSGIGDAIASRLGGLKSHQGAIAETIENNVRSKIIKEHLSDPAYYEKMSELLDEIIALRRAKAIEYEEYLRRIAELARKVEAGHADDTPEPLRKSPGLRALYNNLKKSAARDIAGIAAEDPPDGEQRGADFVLTLAQKIDATVKLARPDGWRGVQAREQVVKRALYDVLQNVDEVERIFPIVKQQPEY